MTLSCDNVIYLSHLWSLLLRSMCSTASSGIASFRVLSPSCMPWENLVGAKQFPHFCYKLNASVRNSFVWGKNLISQGIVIHLALYLSL